MEEMSQNVRSVKFIERFRLGKITCRVIVFS